jgi:hypothetical protein
LAKIGELLVEVLSDVLTVHDPDRDRARIWFSRFPHRACHRILQAPFLGPAFSCGATLQALPLDNLAGDVGVFVERVGRAEPVIAVGYDDLAIG